MNRPRLATKPRLRKLQLSLFLRMMMMISRFLPGWRCGDSVNKKEFENRVRANHSTAGTYTTTFQQLNGSPFKLHWVLANDETFLDLKIL
mmetsp:Transcript_54818/g.75982  ORF Transcript_54818/g.75982 Transcript_54818/m.75982 type:complete len:90 (+) Transcript_54818:581-850(+)